MTTLLLNLTTSISALLIGLLVAPVSLRHAQVPLNSEWNNRPSIVGLHCTLLACNCVSMQVGLVCPLSLFISLTASQGKMLREEIVKILSFLRSSSHWSLNTNDCAASKWITSDSRLHWDSAKSFRLH